MTIGGRVWRIGEASSSETLVAGVETEADLEAFPYGLLLWPSAVALVERLSDHPALVAGKRVLELGAGVGLPGLVAQSLGGRVTQTDHQPEPLALARLNARRNDVAGVETLEGDWRRFPPLPPFDLVIGSDILYERSLHPALLVLLSAVVAPGGLVLLSDPLRPQSSVFIDALECAGWRVAMAGHTIAWRGERTEIALFTARRP